MGLPAIRDGLKVALGKIPELRAFDNMPQTVPETPAAYVIPITGTYHYTMDENLRYEFDVTVIVSLKSSFTEAQELLDQFISPTGDRSIAAALEADPTLGGVCSMLRVDSFSDYGFVSFSAVQYLGCRFRIEIHG